MRLESVSTEHQRAIAVVQWRKCQRISNSHAVVMPSRVYRMVVIIVGTIHLLTEVIIGVIIPGTALVIHGGVLILHGRDKLQITGFVCNRNTYLYIFPGIIGYLALSFTVRLVLKEEEL